MNNSRFDYYADIIINSVNLYLNQPVEIVTPNECIDFAQLLLEKLMRITHNVYVTTTNTKREDNPHLDDENFYNKMMKNDFVRLTITSPFVMPRDVYFTESQSEEVYDYLRNNINQRVMFPVPNYKWASQLGKKTSELLEDIIEIAERKNVLSSQIEKLNKLKLQRLYITTGLGTRLEIKLTEGYQFNDGNGISKRGIPFQINIPSLEIFTSPIIDGVNGTAVGSKPLYIKDKIIPAFKLSFANGRVIDSMGLDSILKLDDSMRYLGEIGLAEYDERTYYSTILDENLATHIALGNAYTLGINKKEISKLNKSKYHVDLPIGTSDMKIVGYTKYRSYVIFENGKYVYNGEE